MRIPIDPAPPLDGFRFSSETPVIAKRGDVVFVECDRVLGDEQMRHIRSALGDVLDTSGVRVVVLERGMKVARIEPQSLEPEA